MTYTILAIDGDYMDCAAPYLRFEDLSWEDASALARLSFDQGFTCVIWRSEGASDGGVG